MKLVFPGSCFTRVTYITLLLIFAFTIFSDYKAIAQQDSKKEDLFVTAFSNEHGLRQSMISQVCQDNLGLIWMVSGDGLHYFDGQEFKAFRVSNNNADNHSDNVMRFLVAANPGLLILSSTSSLLTFNTTSGQFKTIYRRDGFCPTVFETFIDKKPLAWIMGLNFCLVNSTKLDPLKFIFKNGQGIPGDFIPINVVRNSANEILICGENGIIAVNLTGRISDSVFNAEWFPVADFRSLVKTVKGKILVLAGEKLFVWQKDRKLSLLIDTKLSGRFKLFADSRENLWLTDKHSHRIFRLCEGRLQEINLYTRAGKYTEMLTPAIISIFEDHEDNLWFGTDGNGVLLYSPNLVQFQKSNIGFTRCVTQFNDKIWAGTYNNGLWELSPDLAVARRINPLQFNNTVYFLDMMADHSGKLWIATRNGLEIVDKTGNRIWKYPIKCVNAKFIRQTNNEITLSIDSKLLLFKASDKPVFIDSIPYVSARIYLEVDNHYWIGTQFGVYRYNKQLGFDNNNAFSTEKHRLSATPVYGLTLYNGLIWVATGNGIECYNSDGSEHVLGECFMTLKNDVIYTVIADEYGRLWFTGNNGIGCINIPENRVVFFNSTNNLQSLEFNHNAALQTENGHLYFGGINGLNHIDPSSFDPDNHAPVVKLISLFVSDTAYSSCIPPLNPHFNVSRLAPHINGRVFTTDYPNSGEILYSFYLEGYQSEFSKPTRDAGFTYRNLPPGKYRLLVKCADPYLNWSKPDCLLSFTITPPLYTSWWFVAIIILGLIGITVLVVRKVQKVRYQNQIREIERQFAIEKERLRISKDMHDEVGASLTRISILSELAKKQQNEPVKTQQIVDQISEISSNVVDEMSEIIWAMNPRNDTLDSFTSYIRQYVSTYLETAGIDAKFSFPSEISSQHMSSELRRNLFLILKESLHNTVKHSGAHTVNVKLHIGNQMLEMQISDDGKGFVVENKKGTGNGLINMHKRIEDLEGKYTLTSEPGKGTIISLSVSLSIKVNSH